MNTYGGGGSAPPFLSSALDGGEYSPSSPCRFTPGEITLGSHWWDQEPLWKLWRREKSYLAGIRSPAIQLVFRVYIDWFSISMLKNYFLKMETVCYLRSLVPPYTTLNTTRPITITLKILNLIRGKKFISYERK
jgi:hypothetical protein